MPVNYRQAQATPVRSGLAHRPASSSTEAGSYPKCKQSQNVKGSDFKVTLEILELKSMLKGLIWILSIYFPFPCKYGALLSSKFLF